MLPRWLKSWSCSVAKVIEALVKLQYSGGPGLADGYYRHCVVAMTVEIQPSILITRWQVQPSERYNNVIILGLARLNQGLKLSDIRSSFHIVDHKLHCGLTSNYYCFSSLCFMFKIIIIMLSKCMLHTNNYIASRKLVSLGILSACTVCN